MRTPQQPGASLTPWGAADAPKSDRLDAKPMRTVTAGIDDLPESVRAVFAEPPPGRTRLVEAAGYSWHIVEWGEPDDPPILLVHGVTSNSETFWRVGPCVAAAGRRVIAVDLPGHGRTGGWRGRHRWIETATDLAGFIRAAELDQGRPRGRRALVGGDDRRLPARGGLPSRAPRPSRPTGAEASSSRFPDTGPDRTAVRRRCRCPRRDPSLGRQLVGGRHPGEGERADPDR